jgi:hypothetical protein
MELSDATEETPTTQGNDPGTFRFVAQCLNHYATPGVLLCSTNLFKKFCIEQVEQVINNDMTYLYCLHLMLLFQTFFYLEYI